MFCCRWNPIGQPVWIGLSDLPLLFTCWEIEDFYHLWCIGMPSLWWARARHSAMVLRWLKGWSIPCRSRLAGVERSDGSDLGSRASRLPIGMRGSCCCSRYALEPHLSRPSRHSPARDRRSGSVALGAQFMSTRAVGPFRGTESADRGHGFSSGGYGMPGAER